jgi:hypothetical protein
MAHTLTNRIRNGLAVLVIAIISLGTARAAEVTLSGNTTGVVTGVPQLTFTGNAAFTGTTALNIGSFSGPNALGTFFLSTAPLQLVSGTFTLNITFTAPTGINGGQGSSFVASITGSVSPNVGQGGVAIDFGSPQTFTFNNGINSGSFTLTVPDLFVQSGQGASLTAGFTGSQQAVPEPATFALLSIGLLVAGVMLRRRIA